MNIVMQEHELLDIHYALGLRWDYLERQRLYYRGTSFDTDLAKICEARLIIQNKLQWHRGVDKKDEDG